MTVKTSNNGELSPIIFYYYNMTGTESYHRLLEDWFRQTGHERPIVFREWNCYSDLPETDADLVSYDGVVLSALAAKGFLAPVPDSVSADDAFPWIHERSKYRNKTYGLPVMMCSSALICRKKDDLHVANVMEIHEQVAIPMRSMLLYYFIQAFCTNLDMHKSLKVMDHLVELMGGREYLADSSFADFDGISRFNREDCRYLLGFTENIASLKKDDYVVTFANFSEKKNNKRPLFLVDFVSLAKSVRDEKRQDCLDLMKIMTSGEFVYDVCTLDDKLQYLLPANRSVFPKLAKLDPLYRSLYGLLESRENGVLRYSNQYYETFREKRDILLNFLWDRAGWKPAWKIFDD